MKITEKRSVGKKKAANTASSDAYIKIQKRLVVLLFPNQPAINFSLEIPDLCCAGQSPTYTYKAWVWCAYINALYAASIQLGFERDRILFRKIWRRVKSSTRR